MTVVPIKPELVQCRTCGHFVTPGQLAAHQCEGPLVAGLRSAAIRLLVDPENEAAQKALRKALSEFA